MYSDTIDHFAKLAKVKAALLKNNPMSFFIGALMAGAYLGMGIVLVFTVAGQLDPSIRPMVMGMSFGIALTLVIFAGSELFTGHTMYMTIGWLKETVTGSEVFKAWGASWSGNLMGALLFGVMVALGHGALYNESSDLLNAVASAKMNKGPVQLFFLAILCNWLVCLAIWTAARTENDAAKCILIFWCLYGFFASGFEHSVANMAVFSMALLGEHPESVSLTGMFYNLFFVTLGNLVSGSVFMAVGYWAASPKAMDQSSKPAKKIKAMLDGSFDLLLKLYGLTKTYSKQGWQFAKEKRQEKLKKAA
ncbi:MAG TPA: nitrite transporter NirC [Methylococcaceae bacterium]|jgi:Formate/nitrite family of transporters|nr:nitrite transporter NirC [Methylococcaceae bacterium]